MKDSMRTRESNRGRVSRWIDIPPVFEPNPLLLKGFVVVGVLPKPVLLVLVPNPAFVQDALEDGFERSFGRPRRTKGHGVS